MFLGSEKGTSYPLHSPVTPSRPLQCVTVCHHVSTGLCRWSSNFYQTTWLHVPEFTNHHKHSYDKLKSQQINKPTSPPTTELFQVPIQSMDPICLYWRDSPQVGQGRLIDEVSGSMGTGSFPGVKSGRGVTLTPHPLLVPWSRKGRAVPLLPLWAVRPVHSVSACTRVHFYLYCAIFRELLTVDFATQHFLILRSQFLPGIHTSVPAEISTPLYIEIFK
jgi:hypothetical protein